LPGGASLHLAWTPHGPDKATFDAATARKKHGGGSGEDDEEEDEVAPPAADGALAFMFEMHLIPRVSAAAAASPNVDREYYRCWEGLESNFDRRGAARAVAAAKAKAKAAE
jgi:homogentisate 1,2-dioxygenase